MNRLLDTRFLIVHPDTRAWWKQRSTCRACAHYQTTESVSGGRAERCKKAVPAQATGYGLGRAERGYNIPCIDARLPGEPCGPDANLFEPMESQT